MTNVPALPPAGEEMPSALVRYAWLSVSICTAMSSRLGVKRSSLAATSITSVEKNPTISTGRGNRNELRWVVWTVPSKNVLISHVMGDAGA